MMLFKDIAYLAFAMLFAGQAFNPSAAKVVACAAGNVNRGNYSQAIANASESHIKAAPFLNTSSANLSSTVSGHGTPRTHEIAKDTKSITHTLPQYTSIPASRMITPDFTVTFTTTPKGKSASSSITSVISTLNNNTTSNHTTSTSPAANQAATSSLSNSSFAVTFTAISPTDTSQPPSTATGEEGSTITKAQLVSTAPSVSGTATTTTTKSGGLKVAYHPGSGMVVGIALSVVAFLSQ